MLHNKPNLLYVFADQWRRSAIGFNKQEPVQTPTMDEFAKNGVVFDHAVSCTPLCSPARASLLTGKYSLSTSVYTNCKLEADHMLQPDEICIGDILKSSGYETGYVGKWHLDLPEQNVSTEPVSGARHWDAYTPPGAKRHGLISGTLMVHTMNIWLHIIGKIHRKWFKWISGRSSMRRMLYLIS